MRVLNLPFKALMFLTLMRPSLVLFLVLWLKLVKDFLKVRRSEERFSRNAETDIVCRLLLEKKKFIILINSFIHIYFFLFNDTMIIVIITLSLHDALPICACYR